MAGKQNIQLANVVSSPETKFSIRTQNRDFNTRAFDSEEANLFEDQFNALVNDFESRMLSELFVQRRKIIGHAAAHAKTVFDERRFGGINAADNEIAFDVLRPGHIRANPADGATINNWEYTHDTSGWADWIGDGSAANDYTVDEDQVVVILGVMDTGLQVHVADAAADTFTSFDRVDTTPTSAINIDRFGRNVDMLPKDLQDARLTDNENEVLVQALPAMVGTENDRVHARIRSDIPGELDDNAGVTLVSEPRLIGVSFGVGSYMNQEDY